MNRSIHLSITLLFLITFSSALADGKYMPPKGVKKLPQIPHQRALIVHREGSETLIVESMLDGQGEAFGWIIPVPAKPTSVEEVSPGVLATLSSSVTARIYHSEPFKEMGLVGLLMFLFPAAFIIIILWRSSKERPRFIQTLLVLALLVVLCCMLLPTLSKAGGSGGGGGTISGVSELAELTAGDFEITVLEAKTADALNQWLEQNGFERVPTAGEGVVADYIRDSWVFVAAKLRREGTGLTKPHPLAITFPAETPVYPMRLTGVGAESMYLELFVAAEAQAVCPVLELEYAGQLKPEERQYQTARPSNRGADAHDGALFRGYEGRWVRLGHPGLEQHFGDGVILTKFAGVLTAEDMATDYVFSTTELKPFRRHWYSAGGAWGRALLWSTLTFLFSTLVLVPTGWHFGGSISRLVMLRWVGAIILATLVVGAVVRFSVPVTDITIEPRSSRYWQHDLNYMLVAIGEAQADDMIKADSSRNEVEHAMVKWIDSNRQGREYDRSSQSLRVEDSPGNFVVLEDSRGIVLRIFDKYGAPIDIPLREWR